MNLENNNDITSVKYVGSADETILFMFFIQSINILQTYYKNKNLDNKTLIGTNEINYRNDDTKFN